MYAKYNDPSQVTRERSSLTKVICYEDLGRDYYSRYTTKMFISCTILFPIFFITMTAIVVRSLHTEINVAVAKPSNHGNIAALILIGIFGECTVLGMDIAGVIYVYEKSDVFKDDKQELKNAANLIVPYVTLAFDLAIAIWMILGLLYLWCSRIHKGNNELSKDYLTQVLPFCFKPCFYIIFGELNHNEAWDMPDDTPANITASQQELASLPGSRASDTKIIAVRRTEWILICMLVAPLFSVSSHIGFILVAWITEPSKTTAVAIVSLTIFVYAFLMFRQCYMANVDVDVKGKPFFSYFICFYPLVQVIIHLYSCIKASCSSGNNSTEFKKLLTDPKSTQRESTIFDTQAFCLIIPWGLFTVGALAFIVISFYELPLETLDLIEYLQNIFQIFFAVIALLITYKIFILSEPEMQKFFKHIRTRYENSPNTNARAQHEDINQEGEAVPSTSDHGDIVVVKSKPSGAASTTTQGASATDSRSPYFYEGTMDDTEVAGELTGELMSVVIHRLPKN